MSALDPKTMQFYLSMGYNEPQIHKAAHQAKLLGIDILDALNLPPDAQLSSAPPAPQQSVPAAQPFSHRNQSSFLTPWKRIKQNDYEIFFSKTNKHQQSGVKIELREEKYPVGLLNVSNCCYLNSLLQCYFLLNDFKSAILTAEPLPNLEETLANESKTKVKRIRSEYKMLQKLKHFFTTMALTSKRYLDPTTVLQNLVDSLGQKIAYGQQKDLSEINIQIIERLSEGLTYSKNHYQSANHENLLNFNEQKQGSTIIQSQQKESNKNVAYNSIFNPRQGTIKRMFYGTRAEYYDDHLLQKQAPIVSDFTGLILNPLSGSLYKALDEEFNFEVEINGGMQKKTAFIRDQPQYLFIYINRTGFDREEGHALKNQNKFTFDFTIYLDRYLEKYRKQHGESHERIKQLLASKNKLKEQINYLQILFKKIEDCQKYTQELQGWPQKLPKEEQFQEQYDRLQERLQKVEEELNQIQSRKEQYQLMYIFVHRGDAVSGHYWGYGRNDDKWYRFDINTKQIMQEQIIIDLQKSSATPYALLFVKQQNLPQFDYRVHLDDSVMKEQFAKNDFRSCLQPKVVNQLITQNALLYQKSLLKSNNNLRDKTFNEYINRFTSVKKVAQKYEDEIDKNRYLRAIPITNNFSLFLWHKKEIQLCKFTLFEQSLYNVSSSRYTVQRLMHQLPLLHLIQKKFKKNLKGELFLKFYSLLPKEVDKLELLYQEYQILCFEVIWSSVVLNEAEFYQDQWNAELAKNKEGVFEPSEAIKNKVKRLLKLIRIRSSLLKSEQFKNALKTLLEPLYISEINNEIVKLLLFSLTTTGIKIESLQQYTDISDTIGSQLVTLNASNGYPSGKNGEEKAQPLSIAVDLITKFNQRILGNKQSNKRPSTRSIAAKNQQQKMMMGSSGFKNSLLTSSSPMKSQTMIKQGSKKEIQIEFGLVTTISTVLVLQVRDSWKLEQLENMKINFDFGPKLMNFLKKMNPLPKIYKSIMKEEKGLTVAELKERGVAVNQSEAKEEQKQQQKVEEESLI